MVEPAQPVTLVQIVESFYLVIDIDVRRHDLTDNQRTVAWPDNVD